MDLVHCRIITNLFPVFILPKCSSACLKNIIRDYKPSLKNYLLRGPEPKISPLLLWHNFNDSMEKESCTEFCSALIISHKVMKLLSFETGTSDAIPVNIEII